MSSITLFNNISDRKKIKKQLSKIMEISGSLRLKEPCSILEPVIILSMAAVEGSGSSWIKANYAFIPDFGRYYFINNVIATHDHMLEFHLSVDVLMTYKDQLLGSSFEIVRSESINSKWFIDNQKPVQNLKKITYQKIGSIPQSATGNKYVLTVSGG